MRTSTATICTCVRKMHNGSIKIGRLSLFSRPNSFLALPLSCSSSLHLVLPPSLFRTRRTSSLVSSLLESPALVRTFVPSLVSRTFVPFISSSLILPRTRRTPPSSSCSSLLESPAISYLHSYHLKLSNSHILAVSCILTAPRSYPPPSSYPRTFVPSPPSSCQYFSFLLSSFSSPPSSPNIGFSSFVSLALSYLQLILSHLWSYPSRPPC